MECESTLYFIHRDAESAKFEVRKNKEANPKRVLLDALLIASGLRGRKLRKFGVNARRVRVAEPTGTVSQLRALAAFGELETDLQDALFALGH